LPCAATQGHIKQRIESVNDLMLSRLCNKRFSARKTHHEVAGGDSVAGRVAIAGPPVQTR
jgi:hypothetical protein